MKLSTLIKMFLLWQNEGNENSGNHGHAGRPGKVGGSSSQSSSSVELDSEALNSMVNADPQYDRDFSDAVGRELNKEWTPSAETVEIYSQEEGRSISPDEIAPITLMRWTGSTGDPVAEVGIRAVSNSLGFGDKPAEYDSWFNERPGLKEDFEKLGRVMYDKTQKMFAEQGIDTVRLYRSSLRPDGSTSGSVHTSWSIKPGQFITTDSGRHDFYADVPVGQIFSTYATGLGNSVEGEVVVMGDVQGILPYD